MDSAVTVDQLRVFTTIVDCGSFSAAAKQLQRTQGAVSYNIATLESLLAVTLFDRRGRRPVLTAEGRALLAEAAAVVERMARFNETAEGINAGLEPSLSIAIDTLYPPGLLAELIGEFERRFPTVSLDVRTGILSAVLVQLQEGHCQIGISGMSALPTNITSGPCTSVELIAVAAPSHPLHTVKLAIGDQPLRDHTNIVLSDHVQVREVTGAGSLGSKVWRINDSEVRRQLVRAGLGWARMPRHQIADDLKQRSLVKLPTKRWKRRNTVVELRTIYSKRNPPGPAGRWFLERASTSAR